jgi:hypothetical protein
MNLRASNLFLFALTVLLAGSAWAQRAQRISVRFEQPRVAVGAKADRAHQAGFVVRAVDSRGRPRAGAAVALPRIVSGGRGPYKTISARVAWAKEQKTRGALALTDASGQARGVFTSGHRTETTTLQVSSGGEVSRASIEQVWGQEEYPIDEETFDNASGDGFGGAIVSFTLRFQRRKGAAWEPITGHRLEVKPNKLSVGVWDPKAGGDSDGDGQPDGVMKVRDVSSEDKAPASRAAWKYFSNYVRPVPMREIRPGYYQARLKFEPPRGPEGRPAFEVVEWKFNVWDNDSYDMNGATDGNGTD